jgi:hypothetical protein
METRPEFTAASSSSSMPPDNVNTTNTTTTTTFMARGASHNDTATTTTSMEGCTIDNESSGNNGQQWFDSSRMMPRRVTPPPYFVSHQQQQQQHVDSSCALREGVIPSSFHETSGVVSVSPKLASSSSLLEPTTHGATNAAEWQQGEDVAAVPSMQQQQQQLHCGTVSFPHARKETASLPYSAILANATASNANATGYKNYESESRDDVPSMQRLSPVSQELFSSVPRKEVNAMKESQFQDASAMQHSSCAFTESRSKLAVDKRVDARQQDSNATGSHVVVEHSQGSKMSRKRLADQETRKTATSGATDASGKRAYIKAIQATSPSKRTEQEQGALAAFEEKKRRKNKRAREDRVKHQNEMDRILIKPEEQWKKEERAFVEKFLLQRVKRNQYDRDRRKRVKAAKEAEMKRNILSKPREEWSKAEKKLAAKIGNGLERERLQATAEAEGKVSVDETIPGNAS